MLNIRFSRLPKHRKFSYQPIWYDEEKENLKNQVDRIQREMDEKGTSIEESKDNIRAAFRRDAQLRKSGNPLSRFYGLRIILIAGVLGLIFYRLLNTDLIATIFEGFSK